MGLVCLLILFVEFVSLRRAGRLCGGHNVRCCDWDVVSLRFGKLLALTAPAAIGATLICMIVSRQPSSSSVCA